MSTAVQNNEGADLKTWVGVAGALIGAFMAIVNIQITNAALLDIEGGIGTGGANGAWISTSYLIGEIIVIPLCDFLSRVFSTRRFLLVNTALFLIFSVACAFAGNLEQMIVLRALQGFTGGVLIPVAFTLVATTLPMSQRPLGMAGFSLAATFAPAIGPTIGGWLSDNYGWEFIFYVNLVPGLVMLVMLWASLEPAPMRLDLLREGDWAGIVTIAIGLGTLQTVLEEGNKDDWFGSPLIVRLSIVAAISLALFLWIELTSKRPLLNLRLLAGRNFGFGNLATFLLGVALYGSVYILPVYLARIQGYNAEQIGLVLAWTGLPQLLLIPFVPWLMKHFGARPLVVVGFALFAASNLMNTTMTADYAADQLLWPNIVRAVGQALVLVPLTAITTAGIAKEDTGSASALFNMMRNLGGAFGIAALQTFLTKREQFHSNILTRSVSLFEEATRARIEELTNYFLSHGVTDQALAQHQAVVAIGRIVRQQAYVMAFSDTFYLLGAILIVALLASLLLKRPDHAEAGGAH